jgi:hypothetical protein
VHKAGSAWLSPALNLNQASMCGDKEFPYTTGTYVMITLTLVLLTLVAAATAVDWVREARLRTQGYGTGLPWVGGRTNDADGEAVYVTRVCVCVYLWHGSCGTPRWRGRSGGPRRRRGTMRRWAWSGSPGAGGEG